MHTSLHCDDMWWWWMVFVVMLMVMMMVVMMTCDLWYMVFIRHCDHHLQWCDVMWWLWWWCWRWWCWYGWWWAGLSWCWLWSWWLCFDVCMHYILHCLGYDIHTLSWECCPDIPDFQCQCFDSAPLQWCSLLERRCSNEKNHARVIDHIYHDYTSVHIKYIGIIL